MLGMLKRLWKDEEGAAAAEYVLILGLAALAIVAGATALGNALSTGFTNTAQQVQTATGGGAAQ